MIDVRNDVLNATSCKQRAFESASLTGQFFFKPATHEAAEKSSSTDTKIAAFRQGIARLQADQGALLALHRFNRHARLELPFDEPQQASLEALKAWKGPHCPIEHAVPPRFKQRPPSAVIVPKIRAVRHARQRGPALRGALT